MDSVLECWLHVLTKVNNACVGMQASDRKESMALNNASWMGTSNPSDEESDTLPASSNSNTNSVCSFSTCALDRLKLIPETRNTFVTPFSDRRVTRLDARRLDTDSSTIELMLMTVSYREGREGKEGAGKKIRKEGGRRIRLGNVMVYQWAL
eukprot:TRINITY_DN73_c0_g1_i1.p1 TRINITY_DN73_c0_g1~~TRINITY_DN73_c0_g1_i1.p1  ORF type:complete len:152 (+),score=31.81 TRINITY_DN73_c0_g1_i1:195-650(+)